MWVVGNLDMNIFEYRGMLNIRQEIIAWFLQILFVSCLLFRFHNLEIVRETRNLPESQEDGSSKDVSPHGEFIKHSGQ